MHVMKTAADDLTSADLSRCSCVGHSLLRSPSPSPPMMSRTLPVSCGPLWYDDLSQSAVVPVRWVWHGDLAAGAVTLLTSRWKTGKTTLLSVLLARMREGGELAGSAVSAGRAVVV